MRQTVTTVLLVCAATLAACGSGRRPSRPSPSPTPNGVIVGLAAPCAGPGPVRAGYVQVVTVHDARGKLVAVQRLSDAGLPAARQGDGRPFRFVLPAGHYNLTAPGDSPASVEVRGGRTSKAVLGAGCL